ncbi:SMI1/KNR4 family protein [Pseudalkalibacillus salsuginis]|uniref:SMI1/KNR4 family protein n=1 Tax=Pseudalkalibacillus salsuginis TaxID=2910972 RepID=UPI001F3FC796|nr:SMI1/KNR4 family protein [Pseudalkalibacillus salsuginis]MCF6409725.1 SMI1/KNR4 family protein [Pseudalkalibacillus salsuginis]
MEETKDKNPLWFGLENEPIGTDREIIKIERLFSVTLPEEYKLFIKRYGGGYFAFTNIFSVKDSEWNIVQINNEIKLIKSHNFIAISENEVGDFYGFKVNNGVCNPKVKFYNHELDQIEETEYQNLYEYLLKVGLKQLGSIS